MDTPWTPDFGRIDRDPPAWATRRPLRIAVLGDFSGGALSGRLETGPALARRRPLAVGFDSLDDALARLRPAFPVPLGAGGAPVRVALADLESFHPDQLYQQVGIFAALADLRRRLGSSSGFAAAAAQMQAWDLDTAVPAAAPRPGRARGAAPSATARLDDFARLAGRPAPPPAATARLDTLLRSLVAPFVRPAPAPQRDALVAAVDRALSETMRGLLHQPDFQNVEALWRGVDFLLRRLDTTAALQVHLIDIGAEEFAADLGGVADLADSGLYRLLAAQPAEEADGGYAYVAACYQFQATPPHAELLGRAARVASHAGAAFLTGIAPDAFADRREPPPRLVRDAFEALRALPEASFLALLAPRFLLRHPYGRGSDPIESFAFEEFTPREGLRGLLWGHPALLALSVLAGRGASLTVQDLPFHYLVDDQGDRIALPCTERLLGTDAAALLRQAGITAVLAHRGEARVRLAGLEAVNGDGLAAPGTANTGRPAPGGGVVLGRAADARPPAPAWTPRERGANATAGAVGAAAAQPAAGLSATPAAEPVEGDDADALQADTAPAARDADQELDALLARLDDLGKPAASEAPDAPDAQEAQEEPMDPDLQALLDSLK